MIPVALTIAGSDSGGGAGIQADLKTFARFEVFGTSVITAITAQNTMGVTGWEAVSPSLVAAQVAAVASDLHPAAAKTGMLANAAVVRAVVDSLDTLGGIALVVDPVMVATSGDLLFERDAVTAMRDDLIRRATLVTPNLDEAEVLLGDRVRDESAMRVAARQIVRELGAGSALVKGGHLEGDELVDILFDGAADEYVRFARPRIATQSTHGTGCTLSAAITAGLATGTPLREATAHALEYLNRAIRTAPGLGSGHGPVNHFA